MAHTSTTPTPDPIALVLLDDSPASSRLTEEHLKDAHVANTLTVVRTPDDLIAILNGDGESGDDHAVSAQPDVFLLDTRLSTGYADDYLSDLVTHPSATSIPIVLLAETEHEAEFIRSTTDYSFPVLTKPLDPDELLDLLRNQDGVGLSVVKHTSD